MIYKNIYLCNRKAFNILKFCVLRRGSSLEIFRAFLFFRTFRFGDYTISNLHLFLKRKIPPISFRGFPNTGEMITLEHRYVYLPEDVELEEEQLAIELEEAFV